MKKSVDITIENKRFHLEEDAYERLQSYLDELKSHFMQQEDGEEIISDIEAAIGGHLEQLSVDRDVISLSDVEALIDKMGTVGDLVGESTDSVEDTKVGVRRMFRNTDDQVIGGVCAGIASYIGINPIIVRLFFILLVIFWGTGIVIYFILWLILPEAKTVHEKMLMRGEPLTVAKIESAARSAFTDGASAVKAGSTFNKIFLIPFHVIGSLLRELIAFLMRIGTYAPEVTGVLLTTGSVIGVYAVIIAAGVLLARMDRINFDPQTAELLTHINSDLLIALSAVFFIAPLILGIVLGISVFQRRNRFKAVPSFALVTLWMLSLGGLVVMLVDFAPHVEALREQEMRDYPMDEQTFSYSDFDALEVNVPARLHVTQGEEWSVEMRGDERALQEVAFNQVASVLVLDWTPEALECVWFCRQRIVDVYITMPDLQSLSFDGRVSADVGVFTGDSLMVELDYLSSIRFESLVMEKVDLRAYSGSEVVLQGRAEDLTINADGSVDVYAFDFEASRIIVSAPGLSKLELNATDSIVGELGNYATLLYRGDPNIDGLSVEEMTKVVPIVEGLQLEEMKTSVE